MMTKTVKGCDGISVERDGLVVTVTLDRPSRRNAITRDMWQHIADLFDVFNEGDSARVVILRGRAGDFSAGADISEFGEVRSDALSARSYERENSRAFSAIRNCHIPVIAAIRGVCLGGGFGLAAACDIRIASREAEFSIPAAKLGLAYPLDAMIDIVSSCGPQMARYLAYSGARLTAQEALEAGFLLAVHDLGEVDKAARKMAQTFAENAPLSIRASKAAISATITGDTDKRILASDFGDKTFESKDYAEGRSAFREKRRALFRGE
jgi:enoyl-CoA hydratase/carnithine racemase